MGQALIEIWNVVEVGEFKTGWGTSYFTEQGHLLRVQLLVLSDGPLWPLPEVTTHKGPHKPRWQMGG